MSRLICATRCLAAATVFASLSICTVSLRADLPTANPADQQRAPSTQPSTSAHQRVSEMPAIVVEGQKLPELREEDPIGSYGQPRWTGERRFPGTRVYVVPENKIEYEYWLRLDVPRAGATEVQQFHEVEIGLPHRFQLDLYFIQRNEDHENYLDQAIELRYAFADWGKLWGNPTLYAEYIRKENASDKYEFKLLLGGEIAPGWHWGSNILFEAEVTDAREYEYGMTFGISRTIIDEKLSVGGEFQASLFDEAGSRGSYSNEVFVGPSMQFKPIPNLFVNFAPLFGITGDTGAAKIFLNIGYEF